MSADERFSEMSDEQVVRLSRTYLRQLMYALRAGDGHDIDAISSDIKALSLELQRRGYGPAYDKD